VSRSLKKLKQQAFESGIEELIEWTNKKGYDIEFDYCVQDEFRPDDRMITISTRQGREKQLYSLLHECGHLILQNNDDLYNTKYPSSAKMAYCTNNKRLERSYKYKVDVMTEEIDAWRKGKDLAKRLDIYIEEDNYYSISTKCLYTYIKSLAT
jgi:hypothetical protein